MKPINFGLLLSLMLGPAAVTGALALFAPLSPIPAHAETILPHPMAPNATTHYVSSVSGSDDNDCTQGAPCRSIQRAVDQAADGDEVLIAAFDNAASALYTATGTAPVVSVDKSLALRGGYVYAHAIGLGTWQRNPLLPSLSTVDGQNTRQGIHISGDVTVILEWLTLRNGHAERGGNLYAENATARFAAVWVSGGTADYGGGLYLKNCHTEFDAVNFELGDLGDLSAAILVQDNTADYGGGMYVDGGDPALSAFAVVSNTATADGGGIYLNQGEALIAGGVILENQAAQRGGGLFLDDSYARIAGTAVYSNTASQGGGFYLDGPLAIWPLNIPIIANNYVRYNQGGGFYIYKAIAGLANNIIADNSGGQAAMYLEAASPYLIHNTFANNASSSALHLAHEPGQVFPPSLPIPSLPFLTNNIIASHTVGVYADSTGLPYPLENRVTLEGTLWWDNGARSDGPGQVVSDADVSGDPRFICIGTLPECVAPYHLGDGSAAVDAGVELTLALPDDDAFLRDIDGQLRPSGSGYDIGADEAVTLNFDVWLLPTLSTAIAAPGETVTHTHRLLNTGTQTDTYDLDLSISTGWASLLTDTPLTLGAQTSVTVQVRVAVPPYATNGMSDTTFITATSQADSDRFARALDVTTVLTGAIERHDVAVSKTADVDSVAAGGVIHYSLLVTRSDTLTRSLAVTLTDTFVPPQALAAWTLPAPCVGTTSTGLITCAWTMQPSSMHYALPVAITTSDTYSGALVNIAWVSAPILDSNPGNNVAQVTVYIGASNRLYLPLVIRSYVSTWQNRLRATTTLRFEKSTK